MFCFLRRKCDVVLKLGVRVKLKLVVNHCHYERTTRLYWRSIDLLFDYVTILAGGQVSDGIAESNRVEAIICFLQVWTCVGLNGFCPPSPDTLITEEPGFRFHHYFRSLN